MAEKKRPQKIYRLNYHSVDPKFSAQISIFGDPAEIRLAASAKSFITITEDGISLSPGMGNPLNLQGMSSDVKYGGMLQDLPFPLTLIPSTTVTPFPKQIIVPPLAPLIETLVSLTEMAGALLG